MANSREFSSSGSKSRDTRGTEPSQDDVREQLKGDAEAVAAKRGRVAPEGDGLSGDSAGEEALDKGGVQPH